MYENPVVSQKWSCIRMSWKVNNEQFKMVEIHVHHEYNHSWMPCCRALLWYLILYKWLILADKGSLFVKLKRKSFIIWINIWINNAYSYMLLLIWKLSTIITSSTTWSISLCSLSDCTSQFHFKMWASFNCPDH